MTRAISKKNYASPNELFFMLARNQVKNLSFQFVESIT